MSVYTVKRCLDRAEANRGNGDYPRIIREHEEVARFDPDPETRRIARGFAPACQWSPVGRPEKVTVPTSAPSELPGLGEDK